MSALRFQQLSLAPIFGTTNIHLTTGWTGLVGTNGCGKTTLLKLCAGTLKPDQGQIIREPSHGSLHFCQQDLSSPDEYVCNFAKDFSSSAGKWRNLLQLNPTALERWNTLSPGEQKRWQIGAALYQKNDFLFLDEPSNHLDQQSRDLFIQSLQYFQGVGIIVSHDRYLLDTLTVNTLWLSSGRLDFYPASYFEAQTLRQKQRTRQQVIQNQSRQQIRTLNRQLDKAKHKQDAADQAKSLRHANPKDHDARSMGAKIRKGWAEARLGKNVQVLRNARDQAIEEAPRFEKVQKLGRSIFLNYCPPERKIILQIHLDQLAIEQHVLIKPLDFTLERTDRIHLQGPNGSGKTTLIKHLLASSPLTPDHLLVLPQNHTAHEVSQMLQETRQLPGETHKRVCHLFASLGCSPLLLEHQTTLSPGEARKLHLALGMGKHVWALILDEPTNHLDLPSIEHLENALSAFPGAILLISHDAQFAQCCTNRSIMIRDQKLTSSSSNKVYDAPI